jgi:hypothetical protein
MGSFLLPKFAQSQAGLKFHEILHALADADSPVPVRQTEKGKREISGVLRVKFP